MTATPGNSLPARNSSAAPPPVETHETRSASPNSCSARTESAPPDDREAVDVRDGLRHRLRALGEPRPLEHAHRSVPEHGLGPPNARAEVLPCLRADVETEPPLGQLVVGDDLRLGIRVERGRGNHVPRQDDVELERILRAHLFGHLAADQHLVRPAAEISEDLELVLDLGAAGDEHERPLDLAQQLAELLQLPLQQQSGVGGQDQCDADGRSMRSVRRAEGVVDEEVTVVGKLAGERLVVLGLTWVEARVLEHDERLVRQELAKPLLDRPHRERRVEALRPPEMRADGHLTGPPLEQELQRRQRGPDPRVVRDPSLLERNVQVGPHEHALARDVCVTDRPRLYAPTGAPTDAATRSATSTSRQL